MREVSRVHYPRGAESATLVFSSYYLGSPASAFGHTFLRLNKAGDRSTRKELLDTGINYAATADTQNGLLYAFKGLTGLFRGEFARLPYYYKVREYGDYESRDLWEYDLNLTPVAADNAGRPYLGARLDLF